MHGEKRLHAIKEALTAIWQNRRALPLAWNILRHGVCDGCAFGAYGLRDNVVRGRHLCTTALNRLRFHTMGALDLTVLADVRRLRELQPAGLQRLGRISCPLLHSQGTRGFVRVPWDAAIQRACDAIRDTAPHQMGFVAAADGVSNEAYYVFQKLARVLGTNNVTVASSAPDATSLRALGATLGIGAASCSFADLIDTDMIVVFAADLGAVNGQIIRHLRAARKRGSRIVAVHRTNDHGSRGYAPAPAMAIPALHTNLIHDFFSVRPGGEVAFANGVLKALIAGGKVAQDFVARHTQGFETVAAAVARRSWQGLEQRSGLYRSDMQRFAGRYGSVSNAVFVYWGEPRRHGRAAVVVRALVNLALARGMLGRDKCGILPILSGSGAQGAADCGLQPDQFPGGAAVNDESARRFSNLWHHPVPANPGLNLRQMIDAAHRGKLKFLYSIGIDLLDVVPDRRFAAEAMARVPMRIHQDVALHPSHLVDPAEAVVVLPAQRRYEQRGGGTTTSTDRHIVFNPEIYGHLAGDSLPDWEILAAIGRRSMPNGELLFPFTASGSVRAEMARVIPAYQGIEDLNKAGDHMQWGGPQLFQGGKFRGMPANRALFSVLEAYGDIADAEARGRPRAVKRTENR